jgi:hypothetical protein
MYARLSRLAPECVIPARFLGIILGGDYLLGNVIAFGHFDACDSLMS